MHGGSVEGPSRKKGGRRRRHGTEEVALQITSMADIFTILLVFLLKSYSVSATNVNVAKDLQLPSARGGDTSVEAMKVEVTASGIQLESEPVISLTNFVTKSGDVSQDGTIPALIKALTKEREKQRAIASAKGEKEEDIKKNLNSQLLIIADKKAPYKLLKLVLASATAKDYTDFKLVVVTQD